MILEESLSKKLYGSENIYDLACILYAELDHTIDDHPKFLDTYILKGKNNELSDCDQKTVQNLPIVFKKYFEKSVYIEQPVLLGDFITEVLFYIKSINFTTELGQTIGIDIVFFCLLKGIDFGISICKSVYDILANEKENAADVFRFFLESVDSIASSKTEHVDEYADKAQIQVLAGKYGKVVDGILENLLLENSEETIFYQNLWDSIRKTPVLKEKEAQIFALYYISIDVRIPYFHLELTDFMSDDIFKEKIKMLFPQYMKACFILNTPLCKKKTQTASLILTLLDSLSDKNDRAVLLALISNYVLLKGKELGAMKEREE